MNRGSESKQILLSGTPASAGVEQGSVQIHQGQGPPVQRVVVHDNDVERELNKWVDARKKLEKELKSMASLQANRDVKEILETQIEVIHDPQLDSQVQERIRKDRLVSGYALYSVLNEYIELMRRADQHRMRERAVDLESIRDRLVGYTEGEESLIGESGDLLFTDELSPTDMISLIQNGAKAVVLASGGVTSHASIIAQSLGIPCVTNVDWMDSPLKGGEPAWVDGERGEVVICPDTPTERKFQERMMQHSAWLREVAEVIRQPNETRCGTRFVLRANAEFLAEISELKRTEAAGIGLLRTETLFLEQGGFDSERHGKVYSAFIEACGDEPVVIRLLDIGGDKLPERSHKEPNPFLGWRGIRLLLDEKELLQQQLRTVLRVASEYPGRVRLLVPMVSDPEEMVQFRKELEKARSVLKKEGVSVEEKIPVGVMVEVPSIALLAGRAAEVADFFSVGSNDLTQYTLAVDRGNRKLSSRFRDSHPAVWKLINIAMEAARNAGIPISVCGEIASQPLLAGVLVGMGINELSMNTASIPKVKKFLCRHSLAELKALSEEWFALRDGAEAERFLNMRAEPGREGMK
ncbi:MAG: phosphoenolpyruvate--protein phosphotransferase [Balneolaceae bacterium]